MVVVKMRALIAILSLAGVVNFGGLVAGQEYETLPVVSDIGKMSREASAIRKILTADNVDLSDPQDRAAFDRFFKGIFFANMTKPERLGQLAADRDEFFNIYVKITKNPKVHEELVKLTLKEMDTIAKGNFHPAVRCNAMLFIANLNKTESPVIGTPTPAEPYSEALPIMGGAVYSPTQIDGVRVAALVGILRHAERDSEKNSTDRIPLEERTKYTTLMMQILDGTKPDGERSPEGQLWMQRRAVDILGAFGDPGVGGAIAKRLDAIVADDKAPTSLRCEAAVALGRLNNPPLNPKETAQHLAALASQVSHEQHLRLVKHQKRILASGDSTKAPAPGPSAPAFPADCGAGDCIDCIDSGDCLCPADDGGIDDGGGGGVDVGGGGGGNAAGLFDPRAAGGRPAASPLPYRERYKVELGKRRLLYQLQCVKQGLKGPNQSGRGISSLPGADEAETKQYIDDLIKNVEATFEAAKGPAKKNDDANPAEELNNLINALNDSVAKLDEGAGITPPAAPVDPSAPPADEPSGPPVPESCEPPTETPGPPAPAPSEPPPGPPTASPKTPAPALPK